MAYDCGPQHVRSLDSNDVLFSICLETLSIDEDCKVVEGMDEEVIAFEEPRNKRTSVRRKEKTYRLMVETLQLNTMLATYSKGLRLI